MGRLKQREKEIWKMHPEFTDYEVSDLGRVRRRTFGINTYIGKIMKPFYENGYILVSIRKNKISKRKSVHRLSLETFVGPCPEKHQGNHKDGIKTNNFLSNLEWVTPKENTNHAVKNGLIKPKKGEQNGYSKLKEGEVRLIRKLLSHKIQQWKIAKMFKVHQGTISAIKCKKGWRHLEDIYC